jgi:hypothetical protein
MKKLFSVLLIVIFSAMCNMTFSQVTTVPAGAGPYATLGAAFTAINAGGVYAGVAVTVNINANLLEPAACTLNGGVFTSCLIRPQGGATRTVTGAAFNEAIIVLLGADNVTIDGLNTGGNALTFNNTNVGTATGSIRMSNGATNNIVRNCTCMGLGTGTTVGGRTINIGQSALDVQGGNNNNIIERNVVIGGRRGIQTFGSAPLGGQLGVTNDGTIIRNNIVKNASSLGIFIGSESRDNTCDSNEVFMDAPVSVGAAINFRGINCQAVGTNNITRNRIHDLTSTDITATYFGILSIPVTLTAPGSNTTTDNYINNAVTLLTNNDGFVEGITISFIDRPYTANVYNNTVRLAGSAAATVGSVTDAMDITNTLAGSVNNVYNNIGYNAKTGGIADPTMTQHLGFDITGYPATGVTLASDYNLGRGTDPNFGWDAGYNGFIYRGGFLSAYKDATCGDLIEQHTSNDNLSFTAGNSFIFTAGTVGGNMAGKVLAAVPRDLLGTLRNATYPYKGCYEAAALKVLSMTICLEAKTEVGESQCWVFSGAGCTAVAQCFGDVDPNTNSAKYTYGDAVSNGTAYKIVRCYNESFGNIHCKHSYFCCRSSSLQLLNFRAFGGTLSSGGCILAGDVNQDSIIDTGDLLDIYNEVPLVVTGCRLQNDATAMKSLMPVTFLLHIIIFRVYGQ